MSKLINRLFICATAASLATPFFAKAQDADGTVFNTPVIIHSPNENGGDTFVDDRRARMIERRADFEVERVRREKEVAEMQNAAAAREEEMQNEIRKEREKAAAVIAAAQAANPAAANSTAEVTDANNAETQEPAQTPAPTLQATPKTAPLTPRDKLMETLFARNPFFADQSTAITNTIGSQQEPPKGLELRSISCVNGKWFFGLTDTTLQKQYIVPLDRKMRTPGLPYSVDFYDDETNTISISDDLSFYTLTLKEPEKPTGKAVNVFQPAQKNAPAAQARRAQPVRTR